jgi:hypothetical protein
MQQIVYKPVENWRGCFRDNPYFTAAVLNPAGDAVLVREAINKRPKAHSLDLAGNRKTACCAG